jgi:hypothetical protein
MYWFLSVKKNHKTFIYNSKSGEICKKPFSVSALGHAFPFSGSAIQKKWQQGVSIGSWNRGHEKNNLAGRNGEAEKWSVRPETAVKLMAVSGKMGKLTRPGSGAEAEGRRGRWQHSLRRRFL